jgi:hypothetical protein
MIIRDALFVMGCVAGGAPRHQPVHQHVFGMSVAAGMFKLGIAYSLGARIASTA